MALAMTRPTKRDDCATLQFKRRTPRHLTAKKGEPITFRFPDAKAGEIAVTAKIGEVIKFSLRTRDPHVAKLRLRPRERVTRTVHTRVRGRAASPQSTRNRCSCRRAVSRNGGRLGG